ncbi:unnamed protein product [Paramecium pentaurelia]|uniref:Peptidase A1 domain-containing protein n=1 Tax=Paramecium pentaurelia TaxID=43138 RepID=A0A8S1U987_9CILI|nr:unnamed protein product [Paramecium pentaurelia]
MQKLILITSLVVSIFGENTNYAQTNWNTVQGTLSMNSTLENYEQTLWLVYISIGVPAQNFTVQIDTGSNILWVPYTDCSRCDISTRYNPNGQKYFQPNGSTYYQAYGSGECSGYVATDIVNIQDTVINTTFAMMFATMEQGFAFPTVMDGIMGISNNQSFTNIFQTSFNAGQIPTELYGLVLNQSPLESYLIFGDIDPNLMSQVQWVIPNDIYRWKLFINSFTINGKDYSSLMGSVQSAILDSGTTDLLVTESLYGVILQDYLIPAGCFMSGGIYCPCQSTADSLAYLPNITVSFNVVNVTIPFFNLLQGYYVAASGDVCQVMMSYLSGPPFMVFGDPALLSIIPIFNKTANQIGIIGGVPNGIPNGDYPGNDEIDEAEG